MDRLKSNLTCSYCLKIYKNPIELPCKDSVCYEHLTEKDVVKINKIKCTKCKQEFEVKENEFPSASLVNQLLNNQVFLSDEEISLKEKFEDSIRAFYEIYEEYSTSKNKLDSVCHDHFQEIRRQLDIHREEMKEKIDEIYVDMIERTKKFETSYSKKLNDTFEVSSLKTLTEKLKEVEEKFREPSLSIESIQQMILNEHEITNKLKSNLNEITKIKDGLKASNHFKPNVSFEKSSFGYLQLREYFSFDPFNSEILTDNQSSELINLCEFSSNNTFKLIYRATRDGFDSIDFHSKCDGHNNTLTIFKAMESSFIFGAYTSVAWESPPLFSGKCKSDPNAFLFSLTNKDNKPCKMNIDPNRIQNAIYCWSKCGPTFGFASPDIYIKSNANLKNESYSCLGNTYKHPQYDKGTNETQSFLAGSYLFQLSEIEVYQKDGN